jgi:hypothetical protein
MLMLLTETVALTGCEMDKLFAYIPEIGYQPPVAGGK